MSVRKAQIESTLRRAISEVLVRHRAADPRIMGMVSVTRVDVSPDLKQGMVYVSVLPDRYEKRTLAGLRHATRFIQNEVSKQMTMKSMPHLDFRLDATLKKEAGIFDAIRRAKARDEESHRERGPTEGQALSEADPSQVDTTETESESDSEPTQDAPAAEDRPQ